MTVKLRGRGSDGKVAIYEGTDDTPFTDPLSDLSRVKFHSDLDYPKVIDERTFNVAFPSRTFTSGGINKSNGVTVATYTLFAHGRPGYPWVLASFNIGGQNVACTGAVPVQVSTILGSGSSPGPYPRWVTVGADATNVYAYEYTVLEKTEATGFCSFLLPAITIPITVWVTDEILEGTQPDPDPDVTGKTIRIAPERVIFGAGKFDSENRYLRAETTVPTVSTLLAGPSLALARNGNTVAWRFECGSFSKSGPAFGGGVTTPTDVVNTPIDFAV